MKKLFMMSVVVVTVCFFAPLTMAIIIAPYSEEMCEGCNCDRAGNIKIFFSSQDFKDLQGILNAGPATTGPQTNISFDNISDAITRGAGDFTADGFSEGDYITVTGSASNDGAYFIQTVTPVILTVSGNLSTEAAGATVTITTARYAEYSLLRFTLSGTDLDPTATPPILCADIAGDPANDRVFTNPPANWNDVVDLEEIDVEVSDKSGNTTADIKAFIAGMSGNQYFEVVVTDIEPGEASASADYTDWPWIQVGLDPNDPSVTIADNESHAIWVNVSAFSMSSRLEASLDTWPNILTYTPGDDQIGHFVVNCATITIQKAGAGSGTVTSTPAGIDCGGTCSANFDNGSEVTLSAAPDAVSAFDGFTGGGCSGNGECTFHLDQDYTITATFNPDGDSDGISDLKEDGGPNGGDGNADGTLDSLQANVATFQSITGSYVTLISETGTVLANVTARVNPSFADAPPECIFPQGFFGLTVKGLTPGAATTVRVILHEKDTTLSTYYKYGPTPDNHADHWYSFFSAGQTGATINQGATQTTILLSFIDGQMGDDDLSANGEITDAGGPANQSGGGGGDCFIATMGCGTLLSF